MTHRSLTLLLSFSLLAWVSVCSCTSQKASPPERLAMEMIRAGTAGEGLGPSPGAAWIEDADQLRAMMDQINRSLAGRRADFPTAVDFDREGILLVWMGRKPTGGFSIALSADQSYVRDRTAFVRLHWIEPAPDAIVTQALTFPFLMIRMQKGDYDRIVVLDQAGRSKAHLRIGPQKK